MDWKFVADVVIGVLVVGAILSAYIVNLTHRLMAGTKAKADDSK